MTIIYRHLRKELLTVFFFLLFSFFFLYLLIDYSLHLKIFSHKHILFKEILFYYLCQFSHYFNILLPLALMMSVIKLLTSMSIHGELSALFCASISFKKLYKPFLHVSYVLVFLCYLNMQWIQPYSFNYMHSFEEINLKESKTKRENAKVLPLSDQSLLIYHHFDEKESRFLNAILVMNHNEIYRINKLFLKKNGVLGEEVDVLIRNSENKIIKKESRPRCFFSKIVIDPKQLSEKNVSPSMQSLDYLFKKLNKHSFSMGKTISDKEALIASYFIYKLLLPWLCLFSVLAPPLYCVSSKRSVPLFFIYAGFLFAFFAFIALINAVVILSSHQILPPFWGIFLTVVPLFTFCLFRYNKLKL